MSKIFACQKLLHRRAAAALLPLSASVYRSLTIHAAPVILCRLACLCLLLRTISICRGRRICRGKAEGRQHILIPAAGTTIIFLLAYN